DPSPVNSKGMLRNTIWDVSSPTAQKNIGIPVTNYVCNWQVFGLTGPKVPGSMPDGASTTGLLYERYTQCNATFGVSGLNPWANPFGSPLSLNANRAGAHWNSTTAPHQQSDNAGLWNKFQAQPPLTTCNSDKYTQSMHSPGMNVLMGDASVKL